MQMNFFTRHGTTRHGKLCRAELVSRPWIERLRNGGKGFFGVIEVVNSYIFFKESQPEEKQNGLTLKKIRRELIAQMIPEPESEEARSRSRAGNDIFNNELKYTPQLL